MQFNDDSNVSDAEDLTERQKKNTKKKLLESDLEDESDVAESGDELDYTNAVDQDEEMEDEETDVDEDEETEESNDADDDDDPLPIEKANKKLKKKQAKEQ